MFNNKFNKNNTIHFDAEEWICTDPDELQFCRIISKKEFEYIQLKNKELIRDNLCLGRQNLLYLNDSTKPKDWWQEIIDVSEYTPDEITEYLESYGNILHGVKNKQDRNQIIAECIFETDVLTDEIG